MEYKINNLTAIVNDDVVMIYGSAEDTDACERYELINAEAGVVLRPIFVKVNDLHELVNRITGKQYRSDLDLVVNEDETIEDVAREMIGELAIMDEVYDEAHNTVTFTGTRDDLHTLHVRYCGDDVEDVAYLDDKTTPVG